MSRGALLVALVAALVPPLVPSVAHADVWQRAIDTTDATRARYEQALREGDELVMQANARSLSATRVAALVDTALRSYREAADVRPEEAEPYFRIATTLESFFSDCEPRLIATWQPLTCPSAVTRPRAAQFDRTRAEETVAAWDAFEARAPLDPRIAEIRFTRAIMRTKLVDGAKDPKAYLAGALRDYEALLDRADGLTGLSTAQVWGNLAETYMMLGRIDDAIEAYKTAIQRGGDTSTYYGLAVALDRDEREAEALEIIRRQGFEAFGRFKRDVMLGGVFFVPAGEVHYYYALVSEAFGYTADAVDAWRRFIASGAHPQHLPRAKAHLAAAQVKLKTTPRVPTPKRDPFDPFW